MILGAIAGVCGFVVFGQRISAGLWDGLAFGNLGFAALNFIAIGLNVPFLNGEKVDED
jgi:hypothetical protein